MTWNEGERRRGVATGRGGAREDRRWRLENKEKEWGNQS